MAFIVIGHVSAGSGDSNAVTTGVLDTTGASLLVLVLSQSDSVAQCVISDSKSNTWNALTSQTETPIQCTIFWSRPSSVGAGHTFTATRVGSVPCISVGAYSGGAATPFDQQNGAHGSAGTTLATGSVLPTRDFELVVAGLAARGGSGVVVGIDGGFTNAAGTFAGATNETSAIAYLIQTAPVAANPTWTVTSAGSVKAAAIATFTTRLPSMLAVF